MKDTSESSSRRLMIETPIPKLLVKMSVPMMVALTVNGLYYLVDAAFVGHAVGVNGVAALAVGFPIDMFYIALAIMFSIGAAGILSVQLGRGENEQASVTLKSIILFTILTCFVLSLVLLLAKDHLIYALGANDAVFPHADNYYSVIIPGAVFVFLSFLGANSARAEGNAGFAAVGMITGAVLNIGLDAIFILKLGWGTAGAAWGTVLARAVTVLMYVWYYWGGKATVAIADGAWRIDFAEIGMMAKIGFSAFLNQVGYSFLAAIVNISIKRYGATLDLSVFGLVSRILIFVTMPLTGIGQGVQAVVGFNYGAGLLKRVKESVRIGYVYSVAFGMVLFIILFAFPEGVLSFFTKSPELIAAGIQPLRLATCAVALIGVQIVTYFYYISVHQVFFSMLTSICRQILFITPFLLILPRFYGMNGVWASFPISDVISAAACLLLFYLSFRQSSHLPVMQPAKGE